MSEIIIETTRGPLVENIIRGNIAVVGRDGKPIAYLGDPDYLTYMRSAAKPLQTSAALECGAIDHFGISEAELAVMCGSHMGDDYHVETLQAILDKLSLDETALTLGADLSFSEALRLKRIAEGVQPRKIYNNCSGKHACMLAICQYMGWDITDYQRPTHPVQVLIRQTVAGYAGIAPEDIIIGVDGCGVPVFALPLSRMAFAYHQLANPTALDGVREQAARRIISAIAAYPQMIAAFGCFCTDLITATKGRIIGKLGADGVYCAAVHNEDIAIAVKIEDGNGAMLAPTVISVLMQMDLLSKVEQQQLNKFSYFDNINCQNDKVGETRAVFQLVRG